MPDLALIKRNVAKMASMKAPEADIDGYIAQSGVTVEDVRNFKPIDPMFNRFPEKLRPGIQSVFDTGKKVVQAGKEMISDIAKPPLRALYSATEYGPEAAMGKKVQPVTLPIVGRLDPIKNMADAVGTGVQSSALAMGNPTAAGATFMGGKAVQEGKQPKDVIGEAAKGAVGGRVLQAIPEEIPGYLKTAGKVIGKTFDSARRGVSEMAGAGKGLKAVESELASQPEKALNTRNQIRDTRFSSGQNLSNMTANFKEKNAQLNKVLQKESFLQSVKNKELLKGVFKNISKTYRSGLDAAEEALAKRGESVTTNEYLNNVINKTISDLQARMVPEDNPAFVTLKNLSKAMTTGESEAPLLDQFGKTVMIPKPNENIPLGDLKNFKNQVYDTVSGGIKQGTEYADQNSYVADSFLRNHGSFVGTKSPELAALNKEFIPMAEARRWAMKSFRPYNEQEIQRGASVLSRLSSGKPNQTDLNYLSTLERGSGRFTGAGDLRGSTTKAGSDIASLKTSFDSAKKSLIDATDFKINQLQNEIAKMQGRGIELKFQRERLQKLLSTRRFLIGLAVAGTAIKAVPGAGKIVSTAIGH